MILYALLKKKDFFYLMHRPERNDTVNRDYVY